MALIAMRDVAIAFGGEKLLDGASLRIEPGERICLVGRNGSGKTTLLKLVEGSLRPDSGEIDRAAGIRIAMLEQAVPAGLEGTCRSVVSAGLGEERSHVAAAAISRLGLRPDAPIAGMSGGLRRRVMLARALALEPDLLLLDEPTNHLDIGSIEWLEDFLARFDKSLLFVTHDRVFLDTLSTRILDLDAGRLSSFEGGYRSYRDKKRAMLEALAAEEAGFDKKLAREEAWIRQGIKARRTRNEGRVRALEKMRETARARRSAPGQVKLRVSEAGRAAKKIMAAQGVGFGYEPGRPIIRDLDATIYRGDKIGIVGPNGCGKTTLLRLLLGQIAPADGEVRLGERLEVAYLDQLREQLDDGKTVIENVVGAGDKVVIDGKPRHVIAYLEDFLFSPEAARTPVRVLSGGERNRLLLAKLFARASNVLVLDEPTNDLDTETLELLEECLLDYAGTVLFVSHDRAFLDNVATGLLVFTGDGRVVERVGGYGEPVGERGAAGGVADGAKEEGRREKLRREKPAGPRRLTFKERLELEALPARIDALEAEQASLHAAMSDPVLYKTAGDTVRDLRQRLSDIAGDLAAALERWEELETIKAAGG